jgi:hypothetical protein
MRFKFLTNRIYSEEVYQKWKATGMLENTYDGYFLSYVFEMTSEILLGIPDYQDKYTMSFPILYRIFKDKRKYYSDDFIKFKLHVLLMEIDEMPERNPETSSMEIDHEAEYTYQTAIKLNWEE